MLVTPASRALFLSISSISGWTSVASTVPVGPDPAGQADAVIAGPGPDVGHGRAARDLEGVEHRLGLLFLDSRSRGTASRPLATTSRRRSAGPCRSAASRAGLGSCRSAGSWAWYFGLAGAAGLPAATCAGAAGCQAIEQIGDRQKRQHGEPRPGTIFVPVGAGSWRVPQSVNA